MINYLQNNYLLGMLYRYVCISYIPVSSGCFLVNYNYYYKFYFCTDTLKRSLETVYVSKFLVFFKCSIYKYNLTKLDSRGYSMNFCSAHEKMHQNLFHFFMSSICIVCAFDTMIALLSSTILSIVQ